MTPKEQEVYTLLKYITNSTCPIRYESVLEISTDKFRTKNILSIDNPQWLHKDDKSVTLDFKNKKVEWYSAYESYHNGSLYGAVTGGVDWDTYLPYAYEKLLPVVKELIRRDIRIEEDKQRDEMYRIKIDERLENMLNASVG